MGENNNKRERLRLFISVQPDWQETLCFLFFRISGRKKVFFLYYIIFCQKSQVQYILVSGKVRRPRSGLEVLKKFHMGRGRAIRILAITFGKMWDHINSQKSLKICIWGFWLRETGTGRLSTARLTCQFTCKVDTFTCKFTLILHKIQKNFTLFSVKFTFLGVKRRKTRHFRLFFCFWFTFLCQI